MAVPTLEQSELFDKPSAMRQRDGTQILQNLSVGSIGESVVL
jgi:hypothetical protein